jgi:hypothetical protein
MRQILRKKWLALLLTIVGLALLATPAFAHHPIMSGEVACVNGNQVITWTVRNSESRSNRIMEITSISRAISGLSVGQTIAASASVNGTETVAGNTTGTVSLTIQGTWAYANPDVVASRTARVTLQGNCGTPTPEPTPVPTLSLTSMCWLDNSTHQMRVTNPQGYDVPFTWDIYGSGTTGTGTATASSQTFFTVPGTFGSGITVRLFWTGGSTVKAVNQNLCSPPPTTPAPTEEVTEEPTTPAPTTPAPTEEVTEEPTTPAPTTPAPTEEVTEEPTTPAPTTPAPTEEVTQEPTTPAPTEEVTEEPSTTPQATNPAQTLIPTNPPPADPSWSCVFASQAQYWFFRAVDGGWTYGTVPYQMSTSPVNIWIGNGGLPPVGSQFEVWTYSGSGDIAQQSSYVLLATFVVNGDKDCGQVATNSVAPTAQPLPPSGAGEVPVSKAETHWPLIAMFVLVLGIGSITALKLKRR